MSVLQLAVGPLDGPGRGQRLLDRAQVGEELGRPRGRPGRRAGPGVALIRGPLA
ncbi:MAG: hypothetical protein ACRDPF_03730 [Streptosporangiaceae bacterium]